MSYAHDRRLRGDHKGKSGSHDADFPADDRGFRPEKRRKAAAGGRRGSRTPTPAAGRPPELTVAAEDGGGTSSARDVGPKDRWSGR